MVIPPQAARLASVPEANGPASTPEDIAAGALAAYRHLRGDGILVPERPLTRWLDALLPDWTPPKDIPEGSDRWQALAETLSASLRPDAARSYWTAVAQEVLAALRDEVPTIMVLPGPLQFLSALWTPSPEFLEKPLLLLPAHYQMVRLGLYQTPDAVHAVWDLLKPAVTEVLRGWSELGVHGILLHDDPLALFPPADITTHYLPVVGEWLDAWRSAQPDAVAGIGLLNGGMALEPIAASGQFDFAWVDGSVDLRNARHWVGDRLALMGGVEGFALLDNAGQVEEALQRTLQAYGRGHGLIVSLTPPIGRHLVPELLGHLVRRVQQWGQGYHALAIREELDASEPQREA